MLPRSSHQKEIEIELFFKKQKNPEQSGFFFELKWHIISLISNTFEQKTK